jgi:hypothetical protein
VVPDVDIAAQVGKREMIHSISDFNRSISELTSSQNMLVMRRIANAEDNINRNIANQSVLMGEGVANLNKKI